MEHVAVYHSLDQYTTKRPNETKLGEQMLTLPAGGLAAASGARFVVVGVSEDIGPRANFGRGGATSAWTPALTALCNVQSNAFLNGSEILVLGHVETADLLSQVPQQAAGQPQSAEATEAMRRLVEQLDARVANVVRAIVAAGKIPVIIGGGHNNALPNLRGSLQGFKERLGDKAAPAVNAINCDPHSDFRPLEGRHSGNGFSYAFAEGTLDRYAVLAMHESYNTRAVVDKFAANKDRLAYYTYDSIFVRCEVKFKQAVAKCVEFCGGRPCGIELDLDAVEDVPASAITPCGISAVQARYYVATSAALLPQVAYLHLCEGAPSLAGKEGLGKLVAYLVTDFVKTTLRRE
eukprot:m51a1_g3943 hypothetical protein (349) ;mRNA; f:296574-297965